MSQYLAPAGDQFLADLGKLFDRVTTLETQIAQGVGTYAAFPCTSLTRPASPRTGQEIYETDTTRLLVWSGAAWEQKAFAGFVCTAATHPASPFQGMRIFETDTGATGVWSGTAWIFQPTQIGTTVLGGNATNIPITIPAGFTQLHGVFTGRQDSGSGGAFCFIRLNGDSGANYVHQNILGQQATASAANAGAAVNGVRVGGVPGSGDTANYFGVGSFVIGNVGSSVFKPVTSYFSCALSTTNAFSGVYGGLWASTAAVTSVALFPNSGNLVAGSSLTIYGLK